MPDSYDSSEASHRALRTIQQELKRHPIVTTVRGFPEGKFTEVRALLAPDRWGTDRENATMTVRWFAGEARDARPELEFHYSDEQADFGWHHHEQEHVPEWGHFQERTGDGEYTYEPQTFHAENPAQLTWEVMSLLEDQL